MANKHFNLLKQNPQTGATEYVDAFTLAYMIVSQRNETNDAALKALLNKVPVERKSTQERLAWIGEQIDLLESTHPRNDEALDVAIDAAVVLKLQTDIEDHQKTDQARYTVPQASFNTGWLGENREAYRTEALQAAQVYREDNSEGLHAFVARAFEAGESNAARRNAVFQRMVTALKNNGNDPRLAVTELLNQEEAVQSEEVELQAQIRGISMGMGAIPIDGSIPKTENLLIAEAARKAMVAYEDFKRKNGGFTAPQQQDKTPAATTAGTATIVPNTGAPAGGTTAAAVVGATTAVAAGGLVFGKYPWIDPSVQYALQSWGYNTGKLNDAACKPNMTAVSPDKMDCARGEHTNQALLAFVKDFGKQYGLSDNITAADLEKPTVLNKIVSAVKKQSALDVEIAQASLVLTTALAQDSAGGTIVNKDEAKDLLKELADVQALVKDGAQNPRNQKQLRDLLAQLTATDVKYDNGMLGQLQPMVNALDQNSKGEAAQIS